MYRRNNKKEMTGVTNHMNIVMKEPHGVCGSFIISPGLLRVII